MSDLFDDDPRAEPGPVRSRRTRALLITAAVVVVGGLLLTLFANIYTDRLWFQSAGYGQVFSTMLWTRIGLFLAFGGFLGAVVALNIYLAYRFRPLFRPSSPEQSSLDRYRDAVTPIRVWLVVGIAGVVGLFGGTSGMGHWRTYMLWRHAQPFGTEDAYFNKDIGFYVFQLPWWHFVVDFAMASLVLGLVAALVTHYLFGGIRLQVTHDRLSGPAQAQISVMLGLFVLAKGIDYYLDRFDLVTQNNPLFNGMNYTGENAVLPAKNILMGVAIICAILFFLNVWRRTWQLPSVGLALLALSAVLIGMIYPALVQQFQVKPTEADKEQPYIAENIKATRAAYDLAFDDAQTTQLSPSGSLSAAALQLDGSAVPVVDPRLVSSAFENLQQQERYYSVPQVLDVDKYEVNGKDRALVLGLREVDQSGLSPEARNWSNLHTVYTHGNGVIAAYANQRNRDDEPPSESGAGGIQWAQGNAQDDLSQELGDFESRIYYGETSPSYSVVGKASDDSGDVELNLPVPGSDLGVETTFDGPGDASVGSTFNQLMFAIKFGEPNFLLSGRVNSNSNVLFDRTPTERVEKVAPWLTLDTDVYPAVVGGRILWIVDGYTTSDRYANAQRDSFESMIDDALQQNTGLQALPTDEVNYIRNAVKATVDAYTGEVTLYAWDETDPILKAWMSAFPGTVQPKSDLEEAFDGALLDHVRYPEDLFKIQRFQFARYHVTDARDWYEYNDRWSVPQDPQDTSTYQAPYRLFSGGSDNSDFVLSSVYVPYGRENLAAVLSVNSDGSSPDFGAFSVQELSNADDSEASNQSPGPGQVSNNFITDPEFNPVLSLLRQSNTVTFGHLLTVPLNDDLLYVQPVYAQSTTNSDASYPDVRYVLARYGNRTGFGANLEAALVDLVGPASTEDPGGDGGTGDGDGNGPDSGAGPGTGTGEQTLQELFDLNLDRMQQAFDRADELQSSGDFQGYLDQVDRGKQFLANVLRYRALLDDGADPDQPPPAANPGNEPSGTSTPSN